ncbi:RELT-like protein 2 isoform X2 [Rhinopithecus roxellana]|uniref:RELT-like protein 2 isoform X2 n=1 Tax=Rhinopithecus roxellana TaxID=61622 RepID=UPI001237966E|nr:RELT-like protein 2 isoform X2 [Rhinopithecus roxellana]
MSEPQPDLEPPQHGLYMLFLLVLVFFLMGLVGFMICHVLKKKGYRCRTSRGSEPDDAQLQPPEDDDMNEDTVERIVRCIIQNEVWMPPPACRTEPPPIITQCTWALQPLASIAAAARGLHLSVRDAPRKEKAAPGQGRPLCSLWAGGAGAPWKVRLRFRVTHIEKRYGLHEHRDGSPTDRSWGSGGGQDPGSGQGSGGGQPKAGMPAMERLPPERPQPQVLASPPVQNGGLRDSSLAPCALEGNPRASAEPTLRDRGRGPSPGLPIQEANGQQSKPDTSDHQVGKHSQDCTGLGSYCSLLWGALI